MKIIDNLDVDEEVISRKQAEYMVEDTINNTARNVLYVVKYQGDIISFSCEYYKFAWKTLRDLKNALTTAFGKEVSEALVEAGVLEVVRLRV